MAVRFTIDLFLVFKTASGSKTILSLFKTNKKNVQKLNF